jgi:hypothetical protein
LWSYKDLQKVAQALTVENAVYPSIALKVGSTPESLSSEKHDLWLLGSPPDQFHRALDPKGRGFDAKEQVNETQTLPRASIASP